MSKTCRRYLLVWLCCWITRISREKKTKRAIFGRRVNYFWPASLKASAVTHRHEWLPREADYERLQGCYWLRFLTRDGSNHPPGISSSEAHSIPVGSSTTKWTQVLVSKERAVSCCASLRKWNKTIWCIKRITTNFNIADFSRVYGGLRAKLV